VLSYREIMSQNITNTTVLRHIIQRYNPRVF
jgi:hypothetical protein